MLLSLAVSYNRTRADSTLPVEHITRIAIDDTRGVAFVMNRDKTLSAYDFSKKEFVLSRVMLPGLELQDSATIIISPEGSFIAILSASYSYRGVTIFKISDLLAHKPLAPTAFYTFATKKNGNVNATFSQDGKTIFFVYADTFAFLSAEESKKQEITLNGILSRVVSIDSDQVMSINQSDNTIVVFDVAHQSTLRVIRVGSTPKEIIYNEVTKKAYVSHIGSNDVYVIDPRKGTLLTTIPMGGDPTSLTYSKQNGNVFVANNSVGTLSIIDDQNKVKVVDLKSPAYFGSSPLMLSFLEKDNILMIVNALAQKFFIYDPVRSVIIKSGDMLTYPLALSASESLGAFFVLYPEANFISMVDPSGAMTQIPKSSSSAGETYFSRPQSIYIASEVDRLFVTNLDDNVITVINATTLKPIAKIPVNKSPQGGIFLKATKKFYTFSPSDSTISIINTADPSYPVTILKVANQPMGMSANQKTKRIYIANSKNATVTVMDGDTDQVIGTVELPKGSFPLVVNINEDDNKVYVGLYGKDSLAVIDGNTNKLEKLITVGENPVWNRYVSSLGLVLVTSEADRKLVVIDSKTNQITQSIILSGNPYRIFFDERKDYIYINFRKENKVIVLRHKKDSSQLEVFKEDDIPYWGQTDGRPYNMVAVDNEKHLAYFTSARKNQVVVVKDELDNEGIRHPLFYASILATGEVVFAKEAQSEKNISIGTYAYIIGGGLVILLGILYIRFRKKTPSTHPLA